LFGVYLSASLLSIFIAWSPNYLVDKIAIGGIPILVTVFGVLSYKFQRESKFYFFMMVAESKVGPQIGRG
jgi:hypothetical protein